MSTQADLLLLNTSNYPGLPIFPYAFVQVSAIAARHDLKVRRLDLLGISRERWPELLRSAIESSRPSMIGIHLRQADSLYIWDYVQPDQPGMPASSGRDYFPVLDTRYLIETLRSVTDIPVTLGGFGFTTHARRLMDHLRPDYGVQGEPDDYFAKFDSVLAGRALDQVDNLIYPSGEGYVFGRRVFYGPSPHPEYTPEIFDDLCRFYGAPGIFADDGPHVAVEVSRGCPYRCYFCTEPLVKGRRIQIRDVDVVMDDVNFLAARGTPRVWFICSEINSGSNDLLLRLAARMREFNAGRRGEPVTWSAYLLPNPALTRTEIRSLLDSGFRPGWNQFMSYDNENLKKTLVPYRTRHALQAQLDWALETRAHDERHDRSARGHRLDMFLGNSFTDEHTISRTLAAANEARLADHHDSGLITRATRVFDLGDGPICGSRESMFSIGPGGQLATPDLLYPTFHYPDRLVALLGSRQEVDEFFGYVEDTFFSHAHRTSKDWCWFLGRSATPELVTSWCAGLGGSLNQFDLTGDDPQVVEQVRRNVRQACDGDVEIVRDLFFPQPERKVILNLTAFVLVEVVIAGIGTELRLLFEYLGITQHDDGALKGSEYDLLKELYSRFGSEGDLLRDVRSRFGLDDDSPMLFGLRYHLYRDNLKLRPDYRELIFPDIPQHHVS